MKVSHKGFIPYCTKWGAGQAYPWYRTIKGVYICQFPIFKGTYQWGVLAFALTPKVSLSRSPLGNSRCKFCKYYHVQVVCKPCNSLRGPYNYILTAGRKCQFWTCWLLKIGMFDLWQNRPISCIPQSGSCLAPKPYTCAHDPVQILRLQNGVRCCLRDLRF